MEKQLRFDGADDRKGCAHLAQPARLMGKAIDDIPTILENGV
jgi:hypothetical protein